MAKRCPACMTDAKDHSRAPADDAAAQDCNARLSRPVAVKHGFQIFLLAEDWFIYTWDAVAHRVLFYNTELWGEWCYHRDGDNVGVMQEFVDAHTPSTLSEGETAGFWADLERSFPGIERATRGST